ncbi:ketopantoate reductase family protein [Halanaeroarchaeum sulfurireducens]|uniref:2-dehydropantoate 2-reductase n=1 Tax=Halanaeroarchaeum sulfurireducens TaxID=1604004 RepID=A0A0F7PAD8_9EURY|nr:2-dehydropantoate 2-reductase [Halanaeroarchaeum sulfurireducens]AKH97677.1 2-dehydropantoate 2-reductase [Halanaeroarchaeum sulfurireducens]ALG82072.1 2-dehydropantoate 2-reductase [Halanaeroarchaeum sulfurireducens]
MHVAVIGAGALGTLLAGRLKRAETSVTLVGHPGRHLDAIADRGVCIERPNGTAESADLTVSTEHDEVAAADWVLLAVKSYDTKSAMADIAPSLDGTTVLSVQNGLGNAETIAEYVDPEQVVVGTTGHGASIPEPGRVDHAGTGETVIGRYFTDIDEEVETIAATLTAADVETRVTDRPRDAIWEKLLINVAINASTALARVPNGYLLTSQPGERLLERAIEEAIDVAQAEGRSVPNDVVDHAKTVARRTATNTSSMRQDIESGSRTEIDALNGAIVSLGRKHDVETPVNQTLADLVRLAER